MSGPQSRSGRGGEENYHSWGKLKVHHCGRRTRWEETIWETTPDGRNAEIDRGERYAYESGPISLSQDRFMNMTVNLHVSKVR
jgi:hypothetical protein